MARDRSARRARQALRGGGLRQAPWRQPTNPYRPTEMLTAEQVELIHRACLRILSDTGMDFLHPEALVVLAKAGAAIGGERARPPEVVEEAIATAPNQFTLHVRNPTHDLRIFGDAVAFCEVAASAPNVSDLGGGRRPGNREDYRNLVRLGQTFNIIHAFGGHPTEPIDLPPATRHLDALADMVWLTDKVFHAYALGRRRILDAHEIARIARGVGYDQLGREPSLFTIVTTSSPLRLDGPMIEGLIEMARMHQAAVITPFTLAGVMAPASLAGALPFRTPRLWPGSPSLNLSAPASPMMYGGFKSNVDMRSGSPAFGTPEKAQAAYEAEMSIWGAVVGGSNLVIHGAAGWRADWWRRSRSPWSTSRSSR